MLWCIYNAEILGIIENYSSFVFASHFSELGECEVIAPYSEENANVLKAGVVLSRNEDRTDGGFRNCFIIRKVTIEYEIERGYIIHARGKGLKDLLSQRVIWERENFEEANVETVVRTVVENNMLPSSEDRQMPHFAISSETAGLTETGTFQLFGENLADWLTSVAKEYGFGWDVYFDGTEYVFEVLKSTDRTLAQSDVEPVIFATELDNLISFESDLNLENYKNAALIGGEGEGSSKRTASVGDPLAVGMDRYEEYVDGSGVSSDGEIITEQTYIKMLEQYGRSELEGHSKLRSFSAEVNTERPYKLGHDFFLGDVVEVRTAFARATSRLSEIVYSEDENGKQTNCNFENWEV